MGRADWPDRLTPPDWGLPGKFREWRPSQFEAVMESLDSDKRFVAQVMPTGTGKSLRYIAEALLAGGRVAFLTQTKGLQDQAMRDFASIGLVNIKGKSNYFCQQYGDCRKGFASRCANTTPVGLSMANTSCDYEYHLFKALSGELVMTNYTFWIMTHKYGRGLGEFDMLVLDEAHAAEEELASALQIYIGFYDVHEVLQVASPTDPYDPKDWRRWAIMHQTKAELMYAEIKQKVERSFSPKPTWIKDMLHLKNLVRRIQMLASIEHSEWIADSTDKGFILDPITPARYSEQLLFLNIPKVVLVSATIRRKTLEMLGIIDKNNREASRSAYDFKEYPSRFSRDRFRVYQIDTQKVDNSCRTEADLTQWTARIDQIVGRRLDRKGIIHTGSYKRRDIITVTSDYCDHLLTNWKGDVTDAIVNKFKASRPPSVLVSPSVTTGYDFPYEDCEYQIIGKVPFPDRTSKILQAREALDKEYSAYKATQALEQAAGRAMRAEDDQCEVFIIDDHFKWFIRAYKHLFTPGFIASLRFSMVLPKVMEKLQR